MTKDNSAKEMSYKKLTFFEYVIGKMRIFFHFCPFCNSSAPNCYSCNVCHDERDSKKIAKDKDIWRRYKYQLTIGKKMNKSII